MSTSHRPLADGDTAGTPDPGAGGASPYRISRAAVVLIAIALGLGLLIGRASVKTDDSGNAPQPSPGATRSSSIVPIGPHSLSETGALCAQQVGKHQLELAVEVRNNSSGPVIFKHMSVQLPNGGFKVLDRSTGTCGELQPPKLEDFGLAPQGTIWLNVLLRTTVGCPATYPVHFTMFVQDQTGQKQKIDVAGFKDLNNVPWSGC
ncbi:MAG TPA: hypothetical protein VGH30_07805 [Jatrophihabitantaceae bacterium]